MQYKRKNINIHKMVCNIDRYNKFFSLLGAILFVVGQAAYVIDRDKIGECLYLACAVFLFFYAILDWYKFETDKNVERTRLLSIV
jgi:hypothetical protein